jgi:hypothetical protein
MRLQLYLNLTRGSHSTPQTIHSPLPHPPRTRRPGGNSKGWEPIGGGSNPRPALASNDGCTVEVPFKKETLPKLLQRPLTAAAAGDAVGLTTGRPHAVGL